MPGVEVVLPWRGGCERRERALDWVVGRYSQEHPDWCLSIAEAAQSPHWIKAEAVTPAIEAADRDSIVIVADADVFTEGLAAAVEAVREGAPWAVPHDAVFRLTEEATEKVLTGADWRGRELDQPPYRGYWGGGVVAAPRETLLDIPLDPRFVGWGQEDHSWGIALTYLAGEAWRGHADLVHLWHPPQERLTRKIGSAEGKALWKRYLAARSDLGQLRQIIEEAKDAARAASQPALHDRPALGVG